MPTKAELKSKEHVIKVKIRKGDTVMIISGKDKGQTGTVFGVNLKTMRAFVGQDDPENPDQKIPLNAVVKHYKAKRQGERSVRYKMPSPIHLSNLMVIDPETKKPTRLGRRKEGDKLVRYAKKSGKSLMDGVDVDMVARREENK